MHYNIKMQVIPSIDVETITELQAQLPRLTPFYKRLQIDFADGKFVNFSTPTVSDLLASLLPHSSTLFDIHLMTLDYQRALDSINQVANGVNFGVIFIHHAAKPPPDMFLENNSYYKLGLVLNPEDEIDTIKQSYDFPNMENIQIMSVNPGPQGRPFLANTLNKVERLRLTGYKNKIFLDGGVNEDSLKTILKQKYLPDFICPGSFFSRAKNIKECVQYLSEVLSHESNAGQNS